MEIDLNNEKEVAKLLKEAGNSKQGKMAMKLPIKFLIPLIVYFAISGFCVNIYWVYCLIKYFVK